MGEVLRRAERGERFTIKVAGRPVATLGPRERRRWLSGAALDQVWRTPAPTSVQDDIEGFPAELSDPFAR